MSPHFRFSPQSSGPYIHKGVAGHGLIATLAAPAVQALLPAA